MWILPSKLCSKWLCWSPEETDSAHHWSGPSSRIAASFPSWGLWRPHTSSPALGNTPPGHKHAHCVKHTEAPKRAAVQTRVSTLFEVKVLRWLPNGASPFHCSGPLLGPVCRWVFNRKQPPAAYLPHVDVTRHLGPLFLLSNKRAEPPAFRDDPSGPDTWKYEGDDIFCLLPSRCLVISSKRCRMVFSHILWTPLRQCSPVWAVFNSVERGTELTWAFCFGVLGSERTRGAEIIPHSESLLVSLKTFWDIFKLSHRSFY